MPHQSDKTVILSSVVDLSTAAVIDVKRGSESRSKYLRRLIEADAQSLANGSNEPAA